MLKTIGYRTLAAIIDATVPASIRQKAPLSFGPPMSEREALGRLRATANKNRALVSPIGQGYYGTITPPVIQRTILENPAWYTAYTPYQPEISQGRLEALLNFQTMVADLTGLDVAKRLVDCGFHAPTESETKAERDQFCDAMLAIRDEVRAIEDGRMNRIDNPLKNAPHTVEDLVGEWKRRYSREQACSPPGAFRVDKYWSPVNRVDNTYGDRNLVCTCPPVSDYAEAAE